MSPRGCGSIRRFGPLCFAQARDEAGRALRWACDAGCKHRVGRPQPHFAPRTRHGRVYQLAREQGAVALRQDHQNFVPFGSLRLVHRDRERRFVDREPRGSNGAPALAKSAVLRTVGGLVFPESPLAAKRDELETIAGFWPDIGKSRAEAKRLLKEAGA